MTTENETVNQRDKEIAELKAKMLALESKNKQLSSSLMEKENMAMKQALGVCFDAAVVIIETLERLFGVEQETEAEDKSSKDVKE